VGLIGELEQTFGSFALGREGEVTHLRQCSLGELPGCCRIIVDEFVIGPVEQSASEPGWCRHAIVCFDCELETFVWFVASVERIGE
jgi:hypothetical protein